MPCRISLLAMHLHCYAQLKSFPEEQKKKQLLPLFEEKLLFLQLQQQSQNNSCESKFKTRFATAIVKQQ